MHKIVTACILSFMIGGYSVVFAGQGPYNEICDDWNEIAESWSTNDVDCFQLEYCTGVSCNFTIGVDPVKIEIKWIRCEYEPQLRITLTDKTKTHEPLIFSHGGRETITGLSFQIFGEEVSLLELYVGFEKQSNGVLFEGNSDSSPTWYIDVEYGEKEPFGFWWRSKVIWDQWGQTVKTLFTPDSSLGAWIDFTLRLCLELLFGVIRICLSPNAVIIPFAPCVTPEELVCQAMEDLADSVTPPTSCSKMTTCDGISCVQRYPFSYGIPPTTFLVDMNTDLIVNSCGQVSMILTARSKQLNLDWTHTFTRSDSMSVDQDLTFGVKMVVAVTMQYMQDSENILTTIEYTMTQASGVTTTEYILQNAEVCIPDCKSELPPGEPTAMTPSPDVDECASWEKIENALEFSLEGGYSISDCVTLPGCRGFACSAMYEWERYQVIIEEFHCQDPTYITVSINGAREQYSQTFTHNETVPIPFAEDIKISVHLVQVSPSMIFLGVTILFPFHSVRFVEVPLVTDQLLRVTPCVDVKTTKENIRDVMTTKENIRDVMTTKENIRDVMTTKENIRGEDDKFTLDSHTLTFGSIAIVFAVILVVALAFYFRRRRQCKDPDKITGNAETKYDGDYETCKDPDKITGNAETKSNGFYETTISSVSLPA